MDPKALELMGEGAVGEWRSREAETLSEAIRVGDAQTRRVLQLQRAVVVARRGLVSGATPEHSTLAAHGRPLARP